MRKRTLTRVAVATLLATSLLSCHKELDVAPGNPTPTTSLTQNDTGFDWENAQYMPAAPGQNIRMPWASGVGSTITDVAIASDYLRRDGWDMVYNTFDSNTNPSAANQPPLYFALYNRFRGIIRYYFYSTGYANYSSQLEHGLTLAPNNSGSTILNFENGAIVDADPGSNIKGFTKTSKVRLNSTSTWYAMQYEIAYDPHYTDYSFESFHPHWNITNVNISSIKLDSKELADINGNVSTPKGGADWTAIATNGIKAAAEIVGIVSGGSSFSDAAAGGLTDDVAGIFSGIFGGNSQNDKEVSLKLNGTITTTGTIVNNGGTVDANFWLPGQTSTSAANIPAKPIINYPIGLFNLKQRPVVHLQVVNGPQPTNFGDPTVTDYYYTSDINEVLPLVQWNGAVFNSSSTGATYSEFKIETVIPDPNPSGDGTWSVSGRHETIGADSYYADYPSVAEELSANGPAVPRAGGALIRVSFKVKANDPNGPQNIFVVKTFAAQVVQ